MLDEQIHVPISTWKNTDTLCLLPISGVGGVTFDYMKVTCEKCRVEFTKRVIQIEDIASIVFDEKVREASYVR